MQTQVRKIDTGKAVDNGLVVMKSNGTKSEVQDESSRSGMIQMLMMQISDPFMMKSQWLRVDQYPEQCQVKSHMLDSSPNN
ncbi:hypothetical protein Tco_1047458 [Tanacetum coccineum]